MRLKQRSACSVSYMHVAEVEGVFSMGIFLFKKGSRLPLHDHPNMSVYTRCGCALSACTNEKTGSGLPLHDTQCVLVHASANQQVHASKHTSHICQASSGGRQHWRSGASSLSGRQPWLTGHGKAAYRTLAAQTCAVLR